MRLIPLYTNPEIADEITRFSFEPFEEGVGPCAWTWVADGALIIDRHLILEPDGTVRTAHDLFWREWGRDGVSLNPR